MEITDSATQSYINILEKINQQLSYGYGSYSTTIAALAVLFTVLTIVAVSIIYFLGSDYKNKMKADREEYKRKLDEFISSQQSLIEEKDRISKEISEKIEATLVEYKKKLKESSAEQKKEIQRAIDKLELDKLTLKSSIGPISVSPDIQDYNFVSATSALFDRNFHKCSKCGFGFYVDNSPLTAMSVLGGKTVTCPKCQNVDTI
jgi:hypothetical protein